MTQGTHVTRNLVHDISPREDLFVEVNHGPFLIDHNIFLSKSSLADWSEGGAYAHNLFAGKIIPRPSGRETPWQEEHGTAIAGLAKTAGGDNRFYNNVFVAPAGLDVYDNTARPNFMAGNVFLNGAKPSKHEKVPLLVPDFDPALNLREENGSWFLDCTPAPGDADSTGPLVTSELLGKAADRPVLRETRRLAPSTRPRPLRDPAQREAPPARAPRGSDGRQAAPQGFAAIGLMNDALSCEDSALFPVNGKYQPSISSSHDALDHLTQKEKFYPYRPSAHGKPIASLSCRRNGNRAGRHCG